MSEWKVFFKLEQADIDATKPNGGGGGQDFPNSGRTFANPTGDPS